jgi:hypothetical protein
MSMYAGVNVGLGWTKVVTERGALTFASIVRERDEPLFPGQKQTTGWRLQCDGRQFEVGENAALYGTGTTLKPLFRDWGDSLGYRVLATAVVEHLAGFGRGPWEIAVGLAIDHFRDMAYRRRVANLWKRDWTTRLGPISVRRALVLPETMGAAAHMAAHPDFTERVREDRLLILDFGHLTTNWLVLQRGVPQPALSGSVDTGVSAALAAATERLAAAMRRPQLDAVDVEMAWLGRAALLGREQPPQPVDVGPRMRDAAERIWPKIEQAVKNRVDARGLLVMAVGGGAPLFESLLRASLPHSDVYVGVDGETQLLNARGLLLQAKASRGRANDTAAADSAGAIAG